MNTMKRLLRFVNYAVCATVIFVFTQPVTVCARFVLPSIKLLAQFVGKLHNGFHAVYCCRFGGCLIGHLASKTYEGV